jgi:hypothetical protein
MATEVKQGHKKGKADAQLSKAWTAANEAIETLRLIAKALDKPPYFPRKYDLLDLIYERHPIVQQSLAIDEETKDV